MLTKFNSFFILMPSPWPLINSLAVMNFVFSLLMFLKGASHVNFFISLLVVTIASFGWWMDFSGELTAKGYTNYKFEVGVKTSMILFIVSEILFFFSFFWSYFHFFSNPVVEVSMMWPPVDLVMFDFSSVPLINTIILLSSGLTLTISHYLMNKKNKSLSLIMLLITVMLGLIFSLLQYSEYCNSFFSVADSVFGTTFFILTGFHGIHVLIGTTFLIVSTILMKKSKSTAANNLSFELASWYWHFVDVVWIFLYFLIYYMSN